MAEAMACGKPVIATGYSGNLEFMSQANSYLVPYELVEIPETHWAHAPGAQWAEPDVDAAARVMRAVWEKHHEARALGSRAREEITTRFSVLRAGAFVEHRLAEARAGGWVAARASQHDARPAIVRASLELAGEIGESLVQAGRSRPTSLVRRLLRRALWPHLEDQRRFEVSVLEALTAMQRSIDELEQRAYVIETRSSPHPHEGGDTRGSEV
jgi:hypothetical protein